MAKYLVTGGCGFIGRHLVDALINTGHTVIVLDDLSSGSAAALPAGADLVEASILTTPVLRQAMAAADGCFHLAAISSVELCREDRAGSHIVNVAGTINVFEAARDASKPKPVIYASSAAIYGDNPKLPLSEDMVPTPISGYGADKYACEIYGRIAARGGVASTGLRLFNIYGPGQDPTSPYSGVMSIFADQIAKGERVTIFGDGNQTRDFIYVGDAVQCMMTAMEQAEQRGAIAQIYNVCTGVQTSILDLVGALERATGRRSQVHREPARNGDIGRSYGDPRRARAWLKWSASTSLDSGLRQTIARRQPTQANSADSIAGAAAT